MQPSCSGSVIVVVCVCNVHYLYAAIDGTCDSYIVYAICRHWWEPSCDIIDPATKEVVAMAHSDPDHPIRHAVMVCIDDVAKRQGGGVWCSDSERKEQGLCSCWSVHSIITTCPVRIEDFHIMFCRLY